MEIHIGPGEPPTPEERASAEKLVAPVPAGMGG